MRGMHKTLKQGGTFVVEPRRLSKASAELRARGFGEITIPPSTETAEKQASRCTDCGVPFCQNACPLQNNIPDWLALSADGDLREAWRVASATSTMPEICGRICPQDRLCEGNCVIEQSGHGTVTIGSVEKYITDPPMRGFVAYERAIRGDTVENDASLQAILEIPLALGTWEPSYEVPFYSDNGVEAPTPLLTAVPFNKVKCNTAAQRDDDPDIEQAVRGVVEAWTSQSNGRVSFAAVSGGIGYACILYLQLLGL